MMRSYYQMTSLEQWTEKLYARLQVVKPEDIAIDPIAKRLRINVHYLDVRSRCLQAEPGAYSMCIDSRLSPGLQRLEFLQELCHLLRHGNEETEVMPARYSQSQADESERFILYASMPYSMISGLSLPERRQEAARRLAEVFQVPEELALQRMEQIQRRVLQGQLIAVMEREAGDKYLQQHIH